MNPLSERSSPVINANASVFADFVRWAYRILLHREVESEKIVADYTTLARSQATLVLDILHSPEFLRGKVAQTLAREHWTPDPTQKRAAANAIFRKFKRYEGPRAPGYYFDFLGSKTRVYYVPGMTQYDGIILGNPAETPRILFDLNEWIGTLQSVLEANGSFVAVELGAGWGPWLVTSALAARQRGITQIQLAGVEASKTHFSYMVQHLSDNGIDPREHFLFEGVVGTTDGFAYFPVLTDPEQDWGAQAVSFAGEPGEHRIKNFVDYRGKSFDNIEKVPSISLTTLLQRFPRIDIIHCDIQDTEGEVIPSAIEELNRRVRRLVVGTHSRKSEGALLGAFSTAGWALESEIPCHYFVADRRVVPYEDGVQVWANPRLG